MKNLLISGHEVAPPNCIVCGKDKPEGESAPGWTYIAGVDPIGSIACSPTCVAIAVKRHKRSGRVDTPEMRVTR